jgi:2'-5' RNA ligase
VALPLPERQTAGLAPFLEKCAEVAPGFAWVPAGNLHLTLRFLGPVEPGPLAELGVRLAAIRAEPVHLALGALGTFGGRRRARVVWLGLQEGQEGCRALAAEVEAACRASGLAPEERPFRAHLTLGRSRARGGSPLPPEELLPGPLQMPAWVAGSLVLFESHLGRPSARYEPVMEFPLRG